jgi:hypothetical protein
MFDVFICHTTEDKDAVARPLAERLSRLGLNVWYDELSLSIGDSLRASIDKGISNSRYGIVILSQTFFDKKWPQNELNAMFSLETNGENRILPVWHKIDKDFLKNNSPLLLDRIAVSTDDGLEKLIKDVVKKIKPEISYRLDGDAVVVVDPTKVCLFKSGWKQTTPTLVHNYSKVVLYGIQVKITILTKGVNSESVEVTVGTQSNLQWQAGTIVVNYDHFRLDVIDEEGRECVYILFSYITPNTTREILIKGTKNYDSFANVRIVHFDYTPSPVQERNNEVAVPFMPHEKLSIKSVSLKMRRKE